MTLRIDNLGKHYGEAAVFEIDGVLDTALALEAEGDL